MKKKKNHSLYSAWNPVTAGVAVWLKSNENTGFPTYVNLFAYFELLVLTMNFLNSTNSVSLYELFQRVSEIAFQSPLPPPCCTTLALLDLNLCAVYPWAGPEHLLWSSPGGSSWSISWGSHQGTTTSAAALPLWSQLKISSVGPESFTQVRTLASEGFAGKTRTSVFLFRPFFLSLTKNVGNVPSLRTGWRPFLLPTDGRPPPSPHVLTSCSCKAGSTARPLTKRSAGQRSTLPKAQGAWDNIE